MTRDEIRATVVRLLCEIAPEIDPTEIRQDVDLRDQFDLDSMDLLNFVVAVDEEVGVDIPESEYGRFTTLDEFVDYLSARVTAA
jgi:acyl carrier protein